MIEKEKYYTPEIEEFGINFEYQYFKTNGAGDFWLDDKITFFNEIVESVEERLFEGLIRVKYLDKEDIESLGFKYVNDLCPGDGGCRWFDLFKKEDTTIVLFNDVLTIRIKSMVDSYGLLSTKSFGETVFHGTIKNKSEFSRLLKQLSII